MATVAMAHALSRISKTPSLLFVLFHAFLCFIVLFTKKVKKAQKSHGYLLP